MCGYEEKREREKEGERESEEGGAEYLLVMLELDCRTDSVGKV